MEKAHRTERSQPVAEFAPAPTVLWGLSYLGLVESIRLVEPLLNHCQINRILDYI